MDWLTPGYLQWHLQWPDYGRTHKWWGGSQPLGCWTGHDFCGNHVRPLSPVRICYACKGTATQVNLWIPFACGISSACSLVILQHCKWGICFSCTCILSVRIPVLYFIMYIKIMVFNILWVHRYLSLYFKSWMYSLPQYIHFPWLKSYFGLRKHMYEKNEVLS